MFGLPLWAWWAIQVAVGEVATVTAKVTEERKGFGWELLHGLSKTVAKIPTFSGSILKGQMTKKVGKG